MGRNKSNNMHKFIPRLYKLKLEIVILVEIRVKQEKASQFVLSSDQHVHYGVYDKLGSLKYWLTAISAHNQLDNRKALWKDIVNLHQSIRGPWCAMCDFNNAVRAQGRIGGRMVVEAEYKGMQEMMLKSGLSEMDSVGNYNTWSNKHVTSIIYSRIDRVLGNVDWFNGSMDKVLKILPPSVSDHALLCVDGKVHKGNRRLKYYNCMADMTEYEEVVRHSWNKPLHGEPMLVLWSKLQRLKPELTKFSRSMSNVTQELEKARKELEISQTNLTKNRMDAEAVDKVKECTDSVIKWNELEENMLKQRAKIDWLRMHDGNNAYFYASIKTKYQNKSMQVLHQCDGTVLTEKEDIHNEVMTYYKNIMGTTPSTLKHVDIEAMRNGKQVTKSQGDTRIAKVTEEEIYNALKGIGDLKAYGIDGYGAKNFKSSCQIIKDDVMATAQDFFKKGNLFRAFNGTIVTLILKNVQAKIVKEYMPIIGCTTFYKIFSKGMTNRLGKVLQDVIHQSQTTFVPCQVIHNHILLAFELMKGYARKGGTPRCMMQIDIQKAYDMVRRGIRQGDRISPLLFVILMEYMNITMAKMQKNPNFNHHSLTVNQSKCKMFCGGMKNDVAAVQNLTGFAVGQLPLRYLGVPLLCKKLNLNHYLPMVDRITSRIRHWTAKLLSRAGRIQLGNTITTAIAQYWMHCFPLLKFVIHKIDALCRSFVGTSKSEVSRKSPLAWKKTCSPIHQGGLNIINLEVWNSITLLKCLWNLCMKLDNLWVKWVHVYYLKGVDVQTVCIPKTCSWILTAIINKRSFIPLIHLIRTWYLL
ncbi:uncharacterized protein LOC131646218 [Vicia villosa]|uniref:uncharacterized protein LOC131646218 n=1 Tax=Vicia villosa TaxID=3911 RepID=UPI00273AF789|nr:uncharacterized protein LOC131646218 [Vicia villosa]